MASRQLPFDMEWQERSHWCWAAIAASAGRYHAPAASHRQCDIANRSLGTSRCCADPARCNRYASLVTALMAAGCFDRVVEGTAPYPQIVEKIDADRPIGMRIEWTDGGASAVMVTGYDDKARTVTLDDPFYGRSIVRFSALADEYATGGRWTHTYLMRSR
jgi:hypothetical protein